MTEGIATASAVRSHWFMIRVNGDSQPGSTSRHARWAIARASKPNKRRRGGDGSVSSPTISGTMYSLPPAIPDWPVPIGTVRVLMQWRRARDLHAVSVSHLTTTGRLPEAVPS